MKTTRRKFLGQMGAIGIVTHAPRMVAGETDTTEARKLAIWKAEIEEREKYIEGRLKTEPVEGDYYEELVPDTFDLAERGALSLNCLTGMLMYDAGYEMYLATRVDTNPAILHVNEETNTGFYGGWLDMPKMFEPLAAVRLMSGSKQNLDIEHNMVRRVLAMTWDDGLLRVPPVADRPWIDPKFEGQAHMPLIPSLLLGMLYFYQRDGDPLWLEHARKIYQTISKTIVLYSGGDSYIPQLPYPNFPASGYPPGRTPESKADPFLYGRYIRGLAKYYEATGDADALELSRKLAMRLRRYWSVPEEPNGEPPGMVGHELGHFWGHSHVITEGTMGLLEYAVVANDEDTKQFVRQNYEWVRDFGITEIGYIPEVDGGNHGETCHTADMVMLGVMLSKAGVGEYWDDVDRWARNQLAEYQYANKAQMGKASRAGLLYNPKPGETADQAIERSLGSFAAIPFVTYHFAHTLNPSWVDHFHDANYCCCNDNGSSALYRAWEGILEDKGRGTVQINLLLNRASPRLDLDSYLPYEGKVVIKNKTAHRIQVRIPNWASKQEVRCQVDGSEMLTEWLNNYLLFEEVKPTSRVVIEFPVAERTIQRTEGGTGTIYTFHFRGNTVVEISPRGSDAASRVSDGKLLISQPATLLAPGLREQDIKVSVEIKAASNCGIVLRHDGFITCLAALYGPGRVIAIHEIDGGVVLPAENSVSTIGLGPNVTLTAEVKGTEARLIVEDGAKTMSTSCTVRKVNQAGAVGLFSSLLNNSTAIGGAKAAYRLDEFRNFRAMESSGKVLFEDRFEGNEGRLSSWRDPYSDLQYNYYEREHQRADKAPMVKRLRFAPAKVIKA